MCPRPTRERRLIGTVKMSSWMRTKVCDRESFKFCHGLLPRSRNFKSKEMTSLEKLGALEYIIINHVDSVGCSSFITEARSKFKRLFYMIIEEEPIIVAPPDTIKKLEQVARRLAKSVNYVGAATVEYLCRMETRDYCFLELNPRLQVEHPVTEWIAEVTLLAAQVAVGMGIPLWQIPGAKF